MVDYRNSSKTAYILNFPQPQKQKDIKSFLALAGDYKCFILNFAKISTGLTELFQKDTSYHFNPESVHSISELANWNKPSLLLQFFNSFAIGAVLSQDTTIYKSHTLQEFFATLKQNILQLKANFSR